MEVFAIGRTSRGARDVIDAHALQTTTQSVGAQLWSTPSVIDEIQQRGHSSVPAQNTTLETLEAPSASLPDLGASPSIPTSIPVRNVAFTLVSIAIVILLLQFMQQVFSAENAAAPVGVTRVQVEQPVFQASTFVWSSSVGLASAANQLIMVLFLTYFMLLSDQLFKRKLVEIVGTLSQRNVTVSVLEDIAAQIEQFLMIQLMTSGVVAIVTGVALWAMGLQQAALWGLLAGVFNSIPYYGPLLVTGGLALVGLRSSAPWA
jgi:hypothetical protein